MPDELQTTAYPFERGKRPPRASRPAQTVAIWEPGKTPRRPQRAWVTALKIALPVIAALPAIIPALAFIVYGRAMLDLGEEVGRSADARNLLLLAWMAILLTFGGATACVALARSRRWWLPACLMAVGIALFTWLSRI